MISESEAVLRPKADRFRIALQAVDPPQLLMIKHLYHGMESHKYQEGPLVLLVVLFLCSGLLSSTSY